MDLLYEIKYSLMTIFPPSVFDIFDIALLSFIIYKIIKFMLENRAGGLFKGLAVFVGAYLVAKIAHMKALTFIFENAFNVGIIALVILFQPELRRSLEKVGSKGITNLFKFSEDDKKAANIWNKPIQQIVNACEKLSESQTGALIVIEQTDKLGEEIASGKYLDAEISSYLLQNIFFKNTPLHDKAVILRDGRLHSAACTLPLTEENNDLGTRHKAAVGMSEKSDAIIIVVSEETGKISVAENGKLDSELSCDKLKMLLEKRLINDNAKKKTEEQNKPEEQSENDAPADDGKEPSVIETNKGGKEDA